MVRIFLTFCSIIAAVYAATSDPVTFRLEACNAGEGGFTCMTKPENCDSVENCDV